MVKHIHHIIPKHAGGDDNPSNLIEVTVEEHAKIHYERYLETGNLYDLGAYHLLCGHTEQSWKIMCSLGGKVQGRKNAESGHMKNIQQNQNHSENGKLGAKVCRTLGVNSFFDPELRQIACSNGGKIGGRKNAESGHCKNISVNYWKEVKSGKKQRSKKFWCYDPNTGQSILVVFGEEIPDGYQKGRKCK